MPLLDVLQHSVKQDCLGAYQERIGRLAERAVAKKDAFHWATFQTAIGEAGGYVYAAPADGWQAIDERGTSEELVLRVLGEKEGRSWLEETSACLASATRTVSTDRPDLSYSRDLRIRSGYAMVTTARVRPGEQETLEEFIRKLAEAIPKVDDTWQLVTRQVVVGNLREYHIVSPVESLARLDTLLPPDQLLSQAFGAAEGGLLYRAGVAAIEHAERRMLRLRPELSHLER